MQMHVIFARAEQMWTLPAELNHRSAAQDNNDWKDTVNGQSMVDLLGIIWQTPCWGLSGPWSVTALPVTSAG